MLDASSVTKVYRCPGENYDISRAVHLARLAVSYAKCRHCPHAPDAPVTLEPSTAEPPAPAALENALFTSEGIRGRYLNDLTRAEAARIAGAFASCLWDDAEGFRLLSPGRPGPCVILAHDERPSSPDIVTGVGQALRRMGCQVVDIGLATRPCVTFAAHHLRAAGGVHVTGAGCDPGWTGLDFLTRGTIACSSLGELDRVAARYLEGYSRPSRRPGNQRTFQAAVPYEAGLLKHFHALRPLKIALACPSRTIRDLFARIFRKLACRLIPVETPTRLRSALDPDDPDFERTARHVRENETDLGLLVEDDGERCIFFEEQGRLVPPIEIAGLLAIDQGHDAQVACIEQSSREAITVAMGLAGTPFAADGIGRYWFAEAYSACDALLTLVHVLHALSRSDAPLSEVLSKKASPA